MIFLPHLAPPPLLRVPRGVETLRLPIEGGEVEAWFHPAPGADAARPAPVAVFFHGNAELRDFQDGIVAGYHALGVSVLVPEYRGYGRCAGRPSQKTMLEDHRRFLEALCWRPDVDPARIVYHGRSLGGGPAFDLAAHRKPAGVIAESTFHSIASMSARYLVPPFLARHPFRSDHVIARLDAPVLIFHGTADRVIPVRHGRRLRDLARNGRYVEFDCGHNDFPGEANTAAYWKSIADFLRDAGVIRLGAAPA